MCGRYVLALLTTLATRKRYDEVRQELQNLGIPVYDCPVAPEEVPHQYEGALDESESILEGVASQDALNDEEPGQAFRPSYNVAPRYHGIVLRGISVENDPKAKGSADPHFAVQLQVMKWGLIPSWTKRRPDYAPRLQTINCRTDSLSAGGMWSSMRGHNRCVVVAQGFYEWLLVGPKERVPHYIRRHDGHPLLFAGLWDAVDLNDDSTSINSGTTEKKRRKPGKTYTYTIITTSSNDDMRFLHDRMPVIFDAGSPALRVWLDPARTEWSPLLQSLLQPWPSKSSSGDASYLDIDVVSKDVNKVGHDSPSLIIPVASRENKANIANFFASGRKGQTDSVEPSLDEVSLTTSSMPSMPKAIARHKRPADETCDNNVTKYAKKGSAPKKAKVQTGQGCSNESDSQMPTKKSKATAGNALTKGSASKNRAGQEITSYFHPKA